MIPANQVLMNLKPCQDWLIDNWKNSGLDLYFSNWYEFNILLKSFFCSLFLNDSGKAFQSLIAVRVKQFCNFWPLNLQFQKRIFVRRDCTTDQVASDWLIFGEKAGSWPDLIFQNYNNLLVSIKSFIGKILCSNLSSFVDSNFDQ